MTLGLWEGIFIWIFLWVIFGSVFEFVLTRRGSDYLKGWNISSFYFLLSAFVVIRLFPQYFHEYLKNPRILPIFFILLAIAANFLIYYFFRKRFARPDGFIARHYKVQFLAMDYRYIPAKFCNILFQQSMVVLLTAILSGAGLEISGIAIAFTVIFTLGHIPLIATMDIEFASYFIVASSVAAWIFPILIIKVPHGFVYAIALHHSFYAASGAVFWAVTGHRKNYEEILKLKKD